jgi:hypothetical protein
MLSSDGPVVYLGYQDSRLGVEDINDYFLSDERNSRKPMREIFDNDKHWNPAISLSSLFGVLDEHGFMESADIFNITIEGEENWLRISRKYLDKIDGQERVMVAQFNRSRLDEMRICANESVLFHHRGSYSVMIVTKLPGHTICTPSNETPSSRS